MNPLAPFQFENKAISVLTDDAGNPWFNAYQVCNVLGFGNARQALGSHVDAEDVQKLDTLTQGGMQSINHINESGMYSLIFGSTKPEAKRFKRWVMSEVLPAIRKTGSYSKPDIFASRFMQQYTEQRALPHLDRYQNSVINRKAASMARQMMEFNRDFLLHELAGLIERDKGGPHGPVDDYTLDYLMHMADVDKAFAFGHARVRARMLAYLHALRG